MLGRLSLTAGQIDAILAALIATGGPFDPAGTWVGAYSTINPRGINTVLADLAMPVGGAATRQALTWGTPYVLNDGSAVVDSTPHVFADTGSDTDNISGVYLADALTAGNLLGWMPETPSVQVSLHHPYSAVVRLTVAINGSWSLSFSWNG